MNHYKSTARHHKPAGAKILGVSAPRWLHFFTSAPNVCRTSAPNLVHTTILAARILRRLLEFLKICAPMC